MSTITRRFEAIRETMNRARSLRDQLGETPLLTEAVRPVLTELACNGDLFPPESFPTKQGSQGTLYELSVDPDLRLALYASTGTPGKYQPPHDHQTWAVISGVRGREHNIYFDRCDDRAREGFGELRRVGQLTIDRGCANGMMGDAFHSIEVVSKSEALHLHLYGRALDTLVGRIHFSSPEGGEYQRFMANPDLNSPLLSPATLAEMLLDGEELAVLDVREELAYAGGHLLAATPAPRSRLELLVPRLLPRRGVRVVIVGSSNADAQQAATKLRRSGYANIAVLSGGTDAWVEAGFAVYDGTSVFSKAFGELVADTMRTPQLAPGALAAKQARGEDVIVLDARSAAEFEATSIPGAMSCPGAELVPRIFETVRSPDTTIVVNCAGRTRSILGAQSLINAGVENPVFALENGTMGWQLAGLPVQHASPARAPAPSSSALRRARQAVNVVAARFEVPFIDPATYASFRANGRRSMYVFDVRLPEAYLAGHVPGALSVPGGQLVQLLDAHVAVRAGRIVLVDDGEGQAVMTAHWLQQMGLDTYVLRTSSVGVRIAGEEDVELLGGEPDVPGLEPHQLRERLEGGTFTLVDCGSSHRYAEAHIRGAMHAVRSLLEADALPMDHDVVFTSEDGALARLAAADQIASGRCAWFLRGGNRAWTASGSTLVADNPVYLTDVVDVWMPPYERTEGVQEAMRAYLAWEVALPERLRSEPSVRFLPMPA